MSFVGRLLSIIFYLFLVLLTVYTFLAYIPSHLVPEQTKIHLESITEKIIPFITDRHLEYQPTRTVHYHPLHLAALYPSETALQILIQYFKMDPNTFDSNGATPLHYAASRSNSWAIETLLENGANPWVYDRFNRTPEQILVLYGPNSDLESSLQTFKTVRRTISLQAELEKAIAEKKEMTITQVERRKKSEFTFQDFFDNFAKKSTPVVITNVLEDMFGIDPEELKKVNWDVDFIKSKCGNKSVEPKFKNLNARTWGRLEDAPRMRVSDFLDYEFRPKNQSGIPSQLYIFDWSLPRTCKELLKGLVIPKYFANDYFQRIPRNGYTSAWPSLFVGRKGTGAAVHIDSGGTNFWMVAVTGRKLWRFASHDSSHLLYPSWSSSTFKSDIINPDYDKFPHLRLLNASETILAPGELLFVPAGSPHQVVNLDDIIAISMNYVDGSNVQLAKRELLISAAEDDDDDDDGEIVKYLEEREPVMEMDPPDMPWEQFYFKSRFNRRFKRLEKRVRDPIDLPRVITE